MPALAIRQDLPAAELRRLARREPDRRAAMRLLAIASAPGACRGPRRHGSPGWSGRRCGMPWSAITPRGPRASTTDPAPVGRRD